MVSKILTLKWRSEMLYANQSLGGVDQQPAKPLKQISYKKIKIKKKKTGNPFLYQLDMTCNSIPTTWQNFERRVWLAGLVVLKAGFWIAPFILVQFLTHNLGIHSGRYFQNESADHLEFWILINLLLNEAVLVYSK